jgi:hypothetical protein
MSFIFILIQIQLVKHLSIWTRYKKQLPKNKNPHNKLRTHYIRTPTRPICKCETLPEVGRGRRWMVVEAWS